MTSTQRICVALGMALGLAACGGDGSSVRAPVPTPTPTPSPSPIPHLDEAPVVTRLQPSETTATAGDAPASVLFGAGCVDPEGGPVVETWSFPSGNPVTATGPSALVAYPAPGAYTARYTCTDREGASSALEWRVVVTAVNEPAALRITVQPPSSVAVRVPLSPAPEVRLVTSTGATVARAGVSVTVSMTGGNGALGGALTVATDSEGRAAFPSIAFTGLAAGQRSFVFTAPGLAGATSSAIEVSAGATALVQRVSADDQVANPGTAVAQPPAVALHDADGNPVVGARVDFAVTQGGGAVSGSPAVTDATGIARATSWTLGAAGAQSLTATAPSLASSPVTFSATARTRYQITLDFKTPPTDAQRLAFTRARARIEQVVLGHLPTMYVQSTSCSGYSVAGNYEDLTIFVELSPIDGPGKILGQSGPCVIRGTSHLPGVGIMQFDTADLADVERRGQLDAVILHEMLHVVGFGSIWDALGKLDGGGTTNPVYTGALAREAFLSFNGGSSWTGTAVPVESGGGEGTAGSHWRETVFKSELMTGYLSGTSQPMSRTTIQSLADLGYEVDPSQADAYSIWSSSLLGSALVLEPPGVDLANDHLPISVQTVDAAGRPTPHP